MTPASRARATSSFCENAVSITTAVRALRDDLLRGGDAVLPGHLDVEDRQVGLELLDQLDGPQPVAGLADDVEALFLEHLAQIHPDQRLVLGDHDAAGLFQHRSTYQRAHAPADRENAADLRLRRRQWRSTHSAPPIH